MDNHITIALADSSDSLCVKNEISKVLITEDNNPKQESNMMSNNQEMSSAKPKYSLSDDLTCGIIEYGSKRFIVNLHVRDNILNHPKKFIIRDDDIYPSYLNTCGKKINFLDFIFTRRRDELEFHFINGNIYDLRLENVEFRHRYNKTVVEQYDVIQYIEGHYAKNGRYMNKMTNPLWRIRENGKEYLLMYCETNALCKLCEEGYNIILNYEKDLGKKISFYQHSNGYIQCSNLNGKSLYIHQLLTNCFGNGKGTTISSVDHLDRDPLNNTLANLMIATREQQEENKNGMLAGTKRARSCTAKKLPDGIEQEMMLKYVVYYKECYDKEREKYREFFKVEHPLLNGKAWASSKSEKVSIIDKLNSANNVARDLMNGIIPHTEKKYPDYITEKDGFLQFDRKMHGKRYNLKMKIPADLQDDTDKLILLFKSKILEKYEGVDVYTK